MLYRHRRLTKFSSWVTGLFGHPITFISVMILTFLWLAAWSIVKFDSNWLGVFSTVTMVVSFLLMFIIQHTADRESTVMQIKLNELIRSSKGAHNALLDLEKLTSQDLDVIRDGYAEIAALARQELRRGALKSATAVVEVRAIINLANAEAILEDPQRLAALEHLRLIDTPPEEYLDRLTRLAQLALNVPVALLSLVTNDRQFFKSQVGLPSPYSESRQTPLSHSFCKHVVVSGAPFIVNDARQNPLVRDNGAVKDLNVLAYCGVPVVSRDQQRLGSFCAIDTEAHVWRKQELEILQTLSAMALDYLYARTR